MITNLQIYLIKYILVTRYIFFLHGVLTKMNQGQIKLPDGMSSIEKELSEITGQLLRLITFNKSVFGNYYGEIIQNI